MNWNIDIPDLPFKKPREIERLELIGKDQREAMDPVEMQERIQDVANSLVQAFLKHKGPNLELCQAVAISALEEIGGSLGGQFGAAMISQKEKAVRNACEDYFIS